MDAVPRHLDVSDGHAPRWGATPLASVGLRTTQAHDADEHAAHLTAWDQRYDQLSAGRFTGQLTELRLPHMQVFRETTSHALRQSCRVWADSFWFGLPETDDAVALKHPPTRINGRRHGDHDIMVRPGDQTFELVTPDHHSLFGVVVHRQTLMQAAADQGCEVNWCRLQEAELLHVSDEARLHCDQTLTSLLTTTDALNPIPAGAAALQDALIGALLALLDAGEVEPSARQSIARRQKVVSQAHQHVMAHPDQAVTVPELCQQLHVSRRTLQYCFDDVMGLSPIQYLRAIRLNGVRRHLRAAALRGQGVQDVAAHWGFWHLSQFASDYRKLFDETPSATLKRGTH